MTVIDFTARRAKSWDQDLTPEQRLKMAFLSKMFGGDKVADHVCEGLSTANLIYGK